MDFTVQLPPPGGTFYTCLVLMILMCGSHHVEADFGSANPPQPCEQGHYCPSQTPSPSRYPCPAGTYTAASNLSAVEQCDECPAGKYCLGGESTWSGSCQPGYFCPAGTKIPTDFACPNGTYNDDYGKSSVWDCKNCTQGHYCEEAYVEPAECARGTYMPYGVTPASAVSNPYVEDVIGPGDTAKRQFDCLPCPGGYWCNPATIVPTECSAGFYSPDGQYECTICEIGHYCDKANTSESDMYNDMRCPAGYFCPAGLGDVSAATDCSQAHYCPEACLEMVNCPVGTYMPNKNAGSVTDCLPCEPGYYCLEESSASTGPCDMGYYCPSPVTNPFTTNPAMIGSYRPRMVPCPLGTYTNVTGTSDLTDCAVCPAGSYCTVGSVTPIDCLRCSVCADGMKQSTPCPIENMTTNSAPLATPCDGCPGLLAALCVTSVGLVISIIVIIYLVYRLRIARTPGKQSLAQIRAKHNIAERYSNDTPYENIGGVQIELSNYEQLGSRQTNSATYVELDVAGPTRG